MTAGATPVTAGATRVTMGASWRRRLQPLLLVAGVGLPLAGCAARSAPGAGDSATTSTETTGMPTLAGLSPDTIPLGRGEAPTLVLTGAGFEPGPSGAFATGANRVRVGRATIEGVASNSSGTTIRVVLPLSYTDTTAKGRPSSFSPGDYPVSVVTPRGTSNTLTLTMIP